MYSLCIKIIFRTLIPAFGGRMPPGEDATVFHVAPGKSVPLVN